jgi:hypothetical protein
MDLIVPIDGRRGRRRSDLVMGWLLHADNGHRNIDKWATGSSGELLLTVS